MLQGNKGLPWELSQEDLLGLLWERTRLRKGDVQGETWGVTGMHDREGGGENYGVREVPKTRDSGSNPYDWSRKQQECENNQASE